MRVLVLSDLHGRKNNFHKALEAQPTAKDVIFLGDGIDGVKEAASFYSDRNFYMVSGNCDFSCSEPATKYIKLGGIDFLITHGHPYNVKSGREKMLNTAKNANVKVALYGHTHIAKVEYIDGIYLVNPGNLCSSGQRASYAVIDFYNGGIFPNIIEL